MPFITVRVIEGVFSDDQKKRMQKELTDTMVAIEGENMRPVTMVVVEEIPSGQWSIGGRCLTTEAVKEMAAGKNTEKAA